MFTPRSLSLRRPVLGLLILLIPGGFQPGQAAVFEGRLALEMEYLGESYFSEQQLTADDLGLPLGSSLTFSDTTRFSDATWLPGQRLELGWTFGKIDRSQVQLTSRSSFNSERLSQGLEMLWTRGSVDRGRWTLRGTGSFREDDRSLVGHGDWRTRWEGEREFRVWPGTAAHFKTGWEHSRTRGDTTSYLYDFDLFRTRLGFSGGSGWLPLWETQLEATYKTVPNQEPGGYRELRVLGAWREKSQGRSFSTQARIRNYDLDQAVGRDYWAVEAAFRNRFGSQSGAGFSLDSRAELADYRGEDELYFDSAEVSLHAPWRMETGPWTVSVGPASEFLFDLNGSNRDYVEWSGKGTLSRLVGLGGFSDVTLEAGYRNYSSESTEVIEVSSLSSSLLRSDYWLLDILALANLPMGHGISLDLVVSASWEFHTHESERIQVTFTNFGINRRF